MTELTRYLVVNATLVVSIKSNHKFAFDIVRMLLKCFNETCLLTSPFVNNIFKGMKLEVIVILIK